MKRKILSIAGFLFIASSLSAQYPLVSIDSIQYVPDQELQSGMGSSSYLGDTVQVEGIVTFNPCHYALSSGPNRIGTWLQSSPGAPWSGIHVLIDPGLLGLPSSALGTIENSVQFADNFQVGNKVKATGIVNNFDGTTQIALLPVQSQITGLSSMPGPAVVSVDSFQQNDGSGTQVQQYLTGEKWEGVYVEFQNVTVVDVQQNGARYTWYVQDGSGNRIQVRDASGYFRNDGYDAGYTFCTGSPTPNNFTPPSIGSFISYIRGIIVEAHFGGYDGYFITPLTPSDIGPVAASPPIVMNILRTPTVATSSQSVTISAKITDNDGTVSSASLHYSFGLGNTTFTSVSMTNISGDTWAGTIPATGTDSTYVNYWIRATDNDNNVANTPDSLATGSFYLVLDDGIDQISDIQKTVFTSGVSIWQGDTLDNVSIEATVTSTLADYDLGKVAIQDGIMPWSGIYIRGTGIDQLLRGDKILITGGVVNEFFGMTELNSVRYTLLSHNNPVPGPITTLNEDSLFTGVYLHTEPYEGMFVRFDDIFVVDTNADNPSYFGEFLINRDSTKTTGVRIDDYSFAIPFDFSRDSLMEGQKLSFIQGILEYSFSNFKVEPRNLNDIAGFVTPYPNSITSFNFNGLNPPVNGTIDQDSLTIHIAVPSTADVTSLAPAIQFSGLSVSPASGVANDFSTPQQYTVTAPIDSSTKTYTVTVDIVDDVKEYLLNQLIKVYPNPAADRLLVKIEAGLLKDVSFSLSDLSGKEILKLDIDSQVGEAAIPLGAISNGIYFYKLQSNQVAITEKLIVVKRE